MPAVKPEILRWARETAGLSLEEAAKKLGIRPARGMDPVDRLLALERGEVKPTSPQLDKMAKHYHRPLIVFYLRAPPQKEDRGTDFRTLPTGRSPREAAIVDALVRNILCRQSMVRIALEDADEADLLPFVGALRAGPSSDPGDSPSDDSHGMPVAGGAGPIHGAGGMTHKALELLGQVLGPQTNIADYYAKPSPREAFSLLRESVEAAGVFVLLQGNLGSHHTSIDVDAFRGFVIGDDVAPFIVINDHDTPAAWSFTLLHEMVHLLMGDTGISGAPAGDRTEQFCNEVASAWLLPIAVLDRLRIPRVGDVVGHRESISAFAKEHNLSGTLVDYRLYKCNRIGRTMFLELARWFRDRWQRNRRERGARRSGGPSYYSVRRHRLGKNLTTLVQRMVDLGVLSTTKAARVLHVRPGNVGKVIERGPYRRVG